MIAMNIVIDRQLTLRPSAHEHSTAHMNNRILRAIECTRNRGSSDLFLDHSSLSPILFPLLQVPSLSLHSSPLPSPLTTTVCHQTPPYPHCIHPTAPLHNHLHNPTLSIFIFIFILCLTNCSLFKQIVVVSCVVCLTVAGGWILFWGLSFSIWFVSCPPTV
jgi:hypothetical protein